MSNSDHQPVTTPLPRSRSVQMPSTFTHNFTCVKCCQLLKFPVMLVENTGNVCGSCFDPSFQSGIANGIVDSLLSQSTIRCTYGPEGCNISEKYHNLAKHEEYCEFRKISCDFINCPWADCVVKFPDHVTEKHKTDILTCMPGTKWNFNLDLNADVEKFVKILKFELIFISVCISKKTDVFSCILRNISRGVNRVGPVKITFKNDGNVKYSRRLNVLPFNDSNYDNCKVEISSYALKELFTASNGQNTVSCCIKLINEKTPVKTQGEPTRSVHESPRPRASHFAQKISEFYALRAPTSHEDVIHGGTIPLSPAQPPSKTGSITAGYPVRSQPQYQQRAPAALYTTQNRTLY